MYLRFCTHVPCRNTRGASWGFFRPAYFYRDHPATPAWLAQALREDIAWFYDHLPVPDRLGVMSKGRWQPRGVCWFRADARDMISRAWGLAALVELAGTPVRQVRAQDPGEVLYRDDYQIVAKDRRGVMPAVLH